MTNSHGHTGPAKTLRRAGPQGSGWLHLAVAAMLLLAASLAEP